VRRDPERHPEQAADDAERTHRGHHHHRHLARGHADRLEHAEVAPAFAGVEHHRVEHSQRRDRAEHDRQDRGRADEYDGL
jgi:hypothetical protein